MQGSTCATAPHRGARPPRRSAFAPWLLAIAATMLPAAAAAAAADGYRFAWLEPFGGHDTANVSAVNSMGDVVGHLYGGRELEWAIWWHDGRRTTFGNAQAVASNASGTVLLWTDQAAWTWSAGQRTPLQWRGYSRVYDMNEAGTVVGSSLEELRMVPTRWDGGVARALPSLDGPGWSEAWAINDEGLIAGYVTSEAGIQRPALWRDDELIELPLPEGLWGAAWNVSSSGVAVGSIGGFLDNGATDAPKAVIWDRDGLHELESVGSWSVAAAISADGVVVGSSTSQAGRGFSTMWVDGAFVDPSQFLDPALVAAGWRLVTTEDINDAGQIVGTAHNDTTGRTVGFIMTPIPEPSSFALLLAGLAVLARCRRSTLTKPAARRGA